MKLRFVACVWACLLVFPGTSLALERGDRIVVKGTGTSMDGRAGKVVRLLGGARVTVRLNRPHRGRRVVRLARRDVRERKPPRRLQAAFGVRPKAPGIGQRVTLNARRSACRAKPCRYGWRHRGPGARKTESLGRGIRIKRRFRRGGTHRVTLKVTDRRGRRDRTTRRFTVGATPGAQAPGPAPAPGAQGPGLYPLGLAGPGCEPGATNVSSPAQVRTEAAAGRDVCVVGAIGDVNLAGLRPAPAATVVIATAGAGQMGAIGVTDAANLTLRGRARSIAVERSSAVTVEYCRLGGAAQGRVTDNLLTVRQDSKDVTLRSCELAWTLAGNSGSNGYGVRILEGAPGSVERLRITNNHLHHIAADAIQGAGQSPGVVIDRNEISYVAPEPGSSEHSDDLQLVSYGPGISVTNNYMHHNGWFDANTPGASESGPYIHGGSAGPIRFENNLVVDNRNFMQVSDLGTGGCAMSNMTFRRNTFARDGTAYGGGAPDLAWEVCSGANNLLERSAVETLTYKYGPGTHTTVRDNVTGAGVTLDAAGNCTSAACNPPGQEPIGYRKPPGVYW